MTTTQRCQRAWGYVSRGHRTVGPLAKCGGVHIHFTGLWRQPDFMRLWAAHTVSLFGTQITLLALPLTAALSLNATPAQMGALGAVEFLPFVLVGLFAGVWVDRLPHRPILILSDVARAALLATIPVTALLGALWLELLYAVAFLVGVATVFSDLARFAAVPALAGRERLADATGKLTASYQVTQVAGPGLAGVLVEWLTGPVAIAADALSYLASALVLHSIRTPEPTRAASERRGVWHEAADGLRLVFGDPRLRAIAGSTATLLMFFHMLLAVYVLYATRELGLAPAAIGALFAVGGLGGIVGALLAGRVVRRLGVGRTLVWPTVVSQLGLLLLPLSGGPAMLAVPLLATGWFVATLGGSIYDITQVSLRQAVTPDHLQGRMSATVRFMIFGVVPLGALLGGYLGQTIGLRATLLVAAAGGLLAPLWVLLSPVWTLREQPVLAEEPSPAIA
jgi:MFS family permease